APHPIAPPVQIQGLRRAWISELLRQPCPGPRRPWRRRAQRCAATQSVTASLTSAQASTPRRAARRKPHPPCPAAARTVVWVVARIAAIPTLVVAHIVRHQ